LDFQNWFETDWLSANLRTQIDVISLPEENPDLTTPEPQVVNMLALEEESQLNQMAVVPAGNKLYIFIDKTPSVYNIILIHT